jgi:hypothetical protein
MATALTIPDNLLESQFSPIVSTRADWSSGWTVQPNLVCESYTWAVSPEIPTATLRWTYGRGLQPGAASWDEVARKSINGLNVRVEYAGLPSWYGVIIDEQDTRNSSLLNSDNERVPSGVQRFTAYGL